MIKITLTHGATDGGRNFATMAVPKVESGLEKDALHLVGIEKGQKVARKRNWLKSSWKI